MDLIKGECLKEMDKLIKEGVVVDSIICDPPYGTTACKWDSVIPFDAMWERLNKLIKPNGAIVLFGSEPFSSALRMSNIKNYKYDWIWEKSRASNFLQAKYMPMKKHEIISVFYSSTPTYNAQKVIPKKEESLRRSKRAISDIKRLQGGQYVLTGNSNKEAYKDKFKYPESIIFFKNVSGNNQFKKDKVKHPTQKPVSLVEYLIKTYTNENELVLDFTMGSGTTGLACKNLNRYFIGIEKDENYFNIAKERIKGDNKK